MQLLCDFFRKNMRGVFQRDESPLKPGRYRFDLIFQHGIGRGYTVDMFSDDPKRPFVSYVCTYLPNAMLSEVQRKATAEARADHVAESRLADTFVNMFLDGREEADIATSFDSMLASRGYPKGLGNLFGSMMYAIFLYDDKIQNAAEGDKRRVMLEMYYVYQQEVFNYAINNYKSYLNGKDFVMLDLLIVARLANRNLDVQAMIMAQLVEEDGLDKSDENVKKFIERTAKKIGEVVEAYQTKKAKKSRLETYKSLSLQ